MSKQVFFLRVRLVARHHIHRAIEMLLSIGATLAQSVRFVAMVRTA